MSSYRFKTLVVAIGAATIAATAAPVTAFEWRVVVNNGDLMPTNSCVPEGEDMMKCRTFNSYNQPSVNANQLVVIRARSKGGGGEDHGGGHGEAVVATAAESDPGGNGGGHDNGGGSDGEHGNQPVHGIYTRDMAIEGPVVRILDRGTLVPEPNNLGSKFVEPPSFPRIDIGTDTVATRGNHQPVWTYFLGDGTETRAGTTGIYTNPYGGLITGASKLGAVPDFEFFEVPEAPGTPFDVFPGAPAVTDGATIAFKGNYPVGSDGYTGVYYRDLVDEPIPSSEGGLAPAGGTGSVVLIANSLDTLIPGTSTFFGSTAPPSAANRQMVFAGFDNEDDPALGGIYLAPMNGTTQPELEPLVEIDGQVPGENKQARFNRLGEGVSFDGRFVAFWGAWGTQTNTLLLQCRTEGNADRVAFCNQQHRGGFVVEVPVNQGIFVHDLQTGRTRAVAKTPGDFDDFVYWNFSGRTPGTGESEEDGELARWRSASFVAVSGLVDGKLTDAIFHAAFKARTGEVFEDAYVDPIDGIYLRQGPGNARLLTVVETDMDGTLIDPEAVDDVENALPVTEMGIERDGFRGYSLAINVSMGTEEAGWAGVYLTEVLK